MDLLFSPIGAAIAVGLAVLALVLAVRPNRTSRALEDRMESYVARDAEHQAAQASAPGELRGSLYERAILPGAHRFIQVLGRLAPGANVGHIQQKLNVAGRPGNLSPADFLGLRILLAAAGLGLGYFYGQAAANPRMALFGPLIGAVIGYMAPNYGLQSRMRRRQETIQRALPDALDMLTVCVEAGLAFESALQRVGQQWEGALSDEFSRLVAEIRLGVARGQALRRFSERCDVPDVSSFVAILIQADSMGTSIAHVLHSQSEQMRVLRRQRAEEKANKAPIKILVAMMMFIFPALFIVILGPAVPKIVEAFSGISGK